MSASKAATEWRHFGYLPFVAALGYATSVLYVYSMGPFFEPLHQEFGWSRAQVSAGISVASLGGAIVCVPFGILVDRIGPRRMALVGVLMMSGVVALLSLATGELSNWLLLWGVVALGTFGVQAPVWTSAVASRFEASRGLAFAVTLCGASVAATAFPILTTWLIGAYGWRVGFAGLGGIWAALVFPILFLFFRGARDKGHKTPAAEPAARANAVGLTLLEGLRSRALYTLLLAGGLFSFTAIALVVHFVPIVTDSGADPLAAAGIASLIGIFSVVGRLGAGVLLDRFPGRFVGAAVFLIPISGCALLLTDGANPFSQAVAAATFGLVVGSEVDVIAYLASRHFGLRNFGALYGALIMALALGTAFGPLAAGAVFDRYDTYAPFLMLTIGLMALSSIALATLSRPPFSAQDDGNAS